MKLYFLFKPEGKKPWGCSSTAATRNHAGPTDPKTPQQASSESHAATGRSVAATSMHRAQSAENSKDNVLTNGNDKAEKVADGWRGSGSWPQCSKKRAGIPEVDANPPNWLHCKAEEERSTRFSQRISLAARSGRSKVPYI